MSSEWRITSFTMENEEYLGPWRFKTWVHKDQDHLNEWRETSPRFAKNPPEARVAALTTVTDGWITMHFSEDVINLALVAHEATHACLWAYDRELSNTRGKKRKHQSIKLLDHPEIIAERIGNLTSLTWYMLQEYNDSHTG